MRHLRSRAGCDRLPEVVLTLEALRERAIELHRAGRLADAAIAYATLASGLMALQRPAEAVASFDTALALQPELVEAHNNRGIALQRLQRTAEALASFERALSLRPQSAELHNNRGNVLRHLQRLPEALTACERALALQGDFAAAHNSRGLVLQALRRPEEAAASYQRALALQPDMAEAHNNLGTVLCELGRPLDALMSCRRALELQPGMHGVHTNLGNALRDLGRPDEALAHYERALLESPQVAETHSHRGNALLDLGRIAEALASYRRAIELSPRHARSHFNMGLGLLLSGELRAGLRWYEWRKQLDPGAAPASAAPVWLGDEDIAGKTLLVYADQALGDTIQFCRYARLAEQRGARVVLAVQAQLRELLASLSPTIRVIGGPGEPPAAVDYHSALMSLPLAFRTTLADIPAHIPYLRADPLRMARWREQLGAAGFRIGIAWQGSRNRIDRGRSVPLAMFAPLAAIPGVRLISLQKDAAPGQPGDRASGMPVEFLDDSFDSGPQAFLDSAAVMMHLDLVISSDTALVHLAGALGRPTWVALQQVPDWRWLLDRADSPWYPTLRLFRQPRRGDWDSVFAAIRQELARVVAAAQRPARPEQR
jgi:tetratricopeptide (TPR) repeat protein